MVLVCSRSLFPPRVSVGEQNGMGNALTFFPTPQNSLFHTLQKSPGGRPMCQTKPFHCAPPIYGQLVADEVSSARATLFQAIAILDPAIGIRVALCALERRGHGQQTNWTSGKDSLLTRLNRLGVFSLHILWTTNGLSELCSC